jgi:hypothetical protein
MMTFNHIANRLDEKHFDRVVEMMKEKLGFITLRQSAQCIWMRQPGSNIDVQFTRSQNGKRDPDKIESQISFLSKTPKKDLEDIAAWVETNGMRAVVGSYSEREYYLDIPEAFVDFVIEAMMPELADYGVSS